MVGYRDPQVGSQPSETVRQTMVGGTLARRGAQTSPSSRSACGVVMSSLTWPNFCRLEDIRRHCTDEVSQSS